MNPVPLLITGFHRSGTSFIAGLLHAGGLHLGADLLKANWSNPHGHFENRDVVAFHDDLLADTLGRWWLPSGVNALYVRRHIEWITRYAVDGMAEGRPFGAKDPRLCLAIRTWAMALPQLHVLFVHRNPYASIASLWRRAWGDLRHNKEPTRNEFLVQHPDIIARMYLQYTSSFMSFASTCDEDRVRIEFVDQADIARGAVNLFECVERRFALRLEPIQPTSIYDETAITETGHALPLDPELTAAVDAMDRAIRRRVADAAVEANVSGAARLETGPGCAHAHRRDLAGDAAAYELAVARERLHRAETLLGQRRAELGRLVQDLESMQQQLD